MVSVEVANIAGSGALNVSRSDFALIGDNLVVYKPFSIPAA